MNQDPFNAFVKKPQDFDSKKRNGLLSGYSLAVKDIFDVKGFMTGCGNPHMLAEASPAAATASAVQKLLDSGATFVGKTQTDELAFSLMGQNAHYPLPINPAAPDRVTGGSSSGSAAAVAGGLADLATGTDTGGSIRAPASFCGLVGLRTTHGAISLEGAMPLAPSFDTFGWFARDLETYRKVADVLLPETHAGPLSRPMRVAELDRLLLPYAKNEYGRMARQIADRLGEAAIISIPDGCDVDELYWCFRTLQSFEAWRAHGDWLTGKDRELGPGVRERFEFARKITSRQAGEATLRRSAFRKGIADTLSTDGFLIMPTVPGPAPLISESFDDLQAFRERALRLLCWSGLSGFPQLTLPLGKVDDAPFGVSLLGPAGSDMVLLKLADTLMEKTG